MRGKSNSDLSCHCDIYFSLLLHFGKCNSTNSSIHLQDLDVSIVASKSPYDEKSDFLPVFRSGSCAERGPKQYMEDEHICIDNLFEHLGATADFPSPGAFYGVRMLHTYLTFVTPVK